MVEHRAISVADCQHKKLLTAEGSLPFYMFLHLHIILLSTHFHLANNTFVLVHKFKHESFLFVITTISGSILKMLNVEVFLRPAVFVSKLFKRDERFNRAALGRRLKPIGNDRSASDQLSSLYIFSFFAPF